jgi:hypothetical protein
MSPTKTVGHDQGTTRSETHSCLTLPWLASLVSSHYDTSTRPLPNRSPAQAPPYDEPRDDIYTRTIRDGLVDM